MTFLCKELNKMEYGHYSVRILVLICKMHLETILIRNMFNMRKRKCSLNRCRQEYCMMKYVRHKLRLRCHILFIKIKSIELVINLI